ncbi:MAG TPA: aldo/keto reductase [Pseudonocardia sp.]|nr:aldo/keto reductase [Pseudonocardia sp.]
MADLLPGPIGLGGANLGNLFAPMTDAEADALLAAAWDGGVRYFDTAPHYGLGLSERRLGRFLAGRPRAEYVLSTKAGRLLRPSPETADRTDEDNLYAVPADTRRVWDFSADGVRRSLEESLQRLGLDRVDVLLLHDPDEHDLHPALATGLPALARLREEGLVRAVGVGSKSTTALLAAARSGAVDLLMVAGRYTLLEQPVAAEVLPECRDRGIGVLAAGVLNSGLLAGPRPGASYEYATVPEDVLARARRLAETCAASGVELPTAALQFPLREPAVRAVVLGAGSAEQLRENLRRLREPVPDALWERLATEQAGRT